MPEGRAARFVAGAALSFALLTGAARAQSTDVTIRLTPAQAPLLTGVTHGVDSTLSVDVVNTNDQGYPLRHITFRVPTGYALRATSRGPAGWATTINGRDVLFQAPCGAPGIPATGATGTFLLDVTPPTGGVSDDVTETLDFVSLGDDACSGDTAWYANARSLTFVRRVLHVVSGQVTNLGGTGALTTSVTVAWTLQNRSANREKRVTMTSSTVPGIGTPSCSRPNIGAGGTGTATCTYSNLAISSGTYTFAARGDASDATSVGITFSYTFGAQVEWLRPMAVSGRAPHEFTIQVVNNSPANVDRVQVLTPNGWSGPSALSGSGGLAPATSGCTAGTACFTGALSERQTATLRFRFSGAPVVTQNTPYVFEVQVRRAGNTTSLTQPVTLIAPLPDVAGLTVLSDASGQVLSWTNTGRADSAHDGVVIFRTAAPAVPASPQDFVDYATSPLPAGVVYADAGGSSERDFADPVVGAYNYRVCNRDAYLVYSGCRTGFWNNQGYVDSAVPRGPWTYQLGGQSLLLPTVAGNRIAIPTNRPAIDVLDLAGGTRLFDPAVLPALPSSSTPATRVVDGRLLLFAADMSGAVTAVNLETGGVAWQKAKAGESFVAGVSGITRSFGGAAFQAAYPVDVLLLGSATTGNVLAIDATTGDTLWTVNAGAQVRALVTYDSTTYRFYVPTAGGGVVAYDMAPSSPTAPPVALPGWQNPGGNYSLYCARSFQAGSIACVDRAGLLRVLDGTTGAVTASRATGLSSPGTLVRVTGAAQGFVVGDGSQVQRLVASGSPTVLSTAGTWLPQSGTISSALVLSVSGYIIVASSDGALHRLRLADAGWLSQSTPVPSVTTPRYLGPIAYDTVTGLFVFGSSEGRIWAIPSSSF